MDSDVIVVWEYFFDLIDRSSFIHGVVCVSFAANAGTNKAASSSTSLNTRKLDEETENLSREWSMFLFSDDDFFVILSAFMFNLLIVQYFSCHYYVTNWCQNIKNLLRR